MLGACLLLRRTMLDEIGGFDEGFPMYGEDIELQYRARRAPAGSAGTCQAPSRCTTTSVSSTARFLSRRTWWHLRGMAQYVRRHPETLLRL